jgi:hypothetical protein
MMSLLLEDKLAMESLKLQVEGALLVLWRFQSTDAREKLVSVFCSIPTAAFWMYRWKEGLMEESLGSRDIAAVVVAATDGYIERWMYRWKEGLMDDLLTDLIPLNPTPQQNIHD